MEEQTAAAALAYPFTVMDAALGEFLRVVAANDGAEWQWKQRTSGSSIHAIMQGKTEILRILVRSMSTSRSSLVLEAAIPSFDKWNDGMRLFQRFEAWVEQDQARLRSLMYRPDEDDAQITKTRGKPGPQRLKANVWAREQAAQGKTIDEMLPEYSRQRPRLSLAEAREALRKALD
jgi:hypothetical protein